MRIRGVCILGGTGFVGHAIAAALFARGIPRVRIVTRNEPRAATLRVLPNVEVVVGEASALADLHRAFDNMDAVVNLVGVLHARDEAAFDEIHAGLPLKVTQACHGAGVRHLLHMSALGAAPDAPSQYLRTKAHGERAVREHANDTAWTIFRPSVIFGEHDRFLNLFSALQRAPLFVPLASATARFQPIWVDDVARCFATALGNPACFGRAYDLAGPKAYSLRELVRFAGEAAGHPRPIVALPPSLAALQAFVMEHLPGKLLTRDNLRSMSIPNTSHAAFDPVFGFQPSSLEAVVPRYLARDGARARFDRHRNPVGR